MHHLLGPANLGLAAFGVNLKRHVLDRAECRRYVVEGSNTQYVPVVQVQIPNSAPQSRVAFASMASKTGCRSPGELEMTCSTSEVAVCCSSDFSLQLVEQPRILDGDDGLVAKFWTSSTCLSVNGRTSWR